MRVPATECGAGRSRESASERGVESVRERVCLSIPKSDALGGKLDTLGRYPTLVKPIKRQPGATGETFDPPLARRPGAGRGRQPPAARRRSPREHLDAGSRLRGRPRAGESAGGVVVRDVTPGSPAAEQGIPMGATIVAVNGQSTRGLTIPEVLKLVDGLTGARELTFTAPATLRAPMSLSA